MAQCRDHVTTLGFILHKSLTAGQEQRGGDGGALGWSTEVGFQDHWEVETRIAFLPGI